MRIFIYTIFYLLVVACSKNNPNIKPISQQLFTKISPSHSKINFENSPTETLSFNFLNYPYIYNGGGVAVLDFNNDGLEDLYFTSNQSSNKLYQNKGNFTFEDVTNKANAIDSIGWTTGVSVVDINQDNWPDLYICKSGSLRNPEDRKNKLFVNNKNGTFTEQAKYYGLDHSGFSTQAYFFDMDLDGDLDMYLVNHRPDFRNNNQIEKHTSEEIKMSDQLFENTEGKFINITEKSGIKNSAWGLSAAIGDFNEDGYPDVFVANDFLQPDYLYINNKNGTFTDNALSYFDHISSNSMGSDFADINNDLLPDLVVLDMMASDHKRSKKNMATMSTEKFNMLVDADYHFQYMTNMLQLNRGTKTFSEIGQLSGIAKTDWSWAPLITDFDNDGYNDIFITNGIQNDLSNQDFRTQLKNNIQNKKKVSLQEAINMMPSEKLHNYLYLNNKNITFSDKSIASGFQEKINSNGATYADLDNDGDLDLIVNNQSEIASLYQNNSTKNYLKVNLIGPNKNKNGIGSKIILYTKNGNQLREQHLSRGFQSSISSVLNFGIDTLTVADSLKIIWPNGKTETKSNLKHNTQIELSYKNAEKTNTLVKHTNQFIEVSQKELGIDFKHHENNFNDYDLQLLLPQKQSTQSKAIAIGDVNNDGLEDMFLGNGFDHAAQLYIQNSNGKFEKSANPIFLKDAKYEDQNAHLFDADNDGDLDLFVASGGYELKQNSHLLQDRLYYNNGKGEFSKANLPTMLTSTKAICTADIDGDNDLDLFIGGRVIPGQYPKAPTSYLLENKNGKFTIATTKKAKGLVQFGMINEAIFTDVDTDGDMDLMIAAEWQPITIFENNNGNLIEKENKELEKYSGWFQTIKAIDFDNDGDLDYLAGNFGKNNKFHPTSKKPLHIYADYFDANFSFDIILSKDLNGELVPVRGKQCSTEQTPFLKKKITSFNAFANATLDDIYGKDKLEKALHLSSNTFESLYIENKGNNIFSVVPLPIECQFGPTLDVTITKSNSSMEVIGVGNVFEAEVETTRYDASKGFIFNPTTNISNLNAYFPNSKNAKAIKQIHIKEKLYYLVYNNNDSLSIYSRN